MSSSAKKFLDIVSGFKNLIFPTLEHEALAFTRAEICAECPDADPEHPFKKYIPGTTQPRGEAIAGMGCKLCNCYLPAKVRSTLSSCPKGLW